MAQRLSQDQQSAPDIVERAGLYASAPGFDKRINEMKLGITALEMAREETGKSLKRVQNETARSLGQAPARAPAPAPASELTVGHRLQEGITKELFRVHPGFSEINTQIALLKVGVQNRCELSLDSRTGQPVVTRYLQHGDSTRKQEDEIKFLEGKLSRLEADVAKEGAETIRQYRGKR